MTRRLFLVLTVLSAMLLWGQTAYAQGEDEYAAGVYSGLCHEIGNEVLTLDAPQFEMGEWRGSEGAPRVLESDNDDIDNVPASELFDTPHVVVVMANDEPVACGEFGGLVGLDRDTDMVFGLAPLDNSGYVGVVDIEGVSREDDDDEFEMNLYVVHPDSISVSTD